MNKEPRPIALIVVLGVVVAGAVGLMFYQSEGMNMPEMYATATAVLAAPSGEKVGEITFMESANGVLIKAEARGLSPGGHALTIHPVETCSPGFIDGNSVSGSSETEHDVGLPVSAGPGHANDLPNIYAASDGTARADFFTKDISMKSKGEDSVFNADGSTIILHEKPYTYSEEASDTGSQVACGVIILDQKKKTQM